LIKNIGDGRVNGYLVRIHVDRFVHFNRLSEQYHLQYPLRGDDLNFKAWIGLGRKRPLNWAKNLVTSSVIERWLQFTDVGAGDGLAPDSEVWIEYEYEVGQHQWGNWFQRTVRHWTKEVSVTLDFPSSFVWKRDAVSLSYSTTSSQRLDEFKLAAVPIDFRLNAGRSLYMWKISDPPLHARYRTEWSFPYWPTSQLDRVGVVQHDDRSDALTTPAQQVEVRVASGIEDANAIARRLSEVADSVEQIHNFTNGLGLAAPQIGIPLQVVLLRDSRGMDDFLINPVIIRGEGEVRDFEGCLSFFDVRGELVRPSKVHVRYTTLDGDTKEEWYEGRRARDVAHEIDHLSGIIYVDKMSDRDSLILFPNLRRPDT
jgi:peptide deformylase